MKLLIFIMLIVCSVPICAQYNKNANNVQFGLKAGTTYSKISGIDRVLVSESYYTGYSFKNDYVWGGTAGIFINYKMEESILAIYSEIMYNRLGTLLQYEDVNDFDYELNVKYNYVTWELFCKAYIYKGLNVHIGPSLGFNVTPDGLFYSSNGEDQYGPDIRMQQDMRNVLKGKQNFSIGAGIGFELDNGLSIEARYYHGLGDVMETLVNNYRFIETKNSCNSFRFTLGYALPYALKFH